MRAIQRSIWRPADASVPHVSSDEEHRASRRARHLYVDTEDGLPQPSNEEIKRWQPASDHAGGGCDRAAPSEGRQCCVSARVDSVRPAAMYLAAAGVGRIGVVDFDVVDYSNPAAADHSRHIRRRVSRSSRRAKDRLLDINPHIQVDTYEAARCRRRTRSSSSSRTTILDGTDNFPTRYLTNDACVLLKAERLRLDLPASRVRRRCLRRKMVRATAASIPSRHLLGWCRAVRKAACLGAAWRHRRHSGDEPSTGIGEPLVGRFDLRRIPCVSACVRRWKTSFGAARTRPSPS